ncbi:unnamed protein product [Coregonus sp. 'balchen']|nr:unnamed protein product [Coregonus sp. 'balchen']
MDRSPTIHIALLKSGWLWRQTSILKRWKLNWCDLWIDGSLVFYKTDSRREFEHRVGLKTSCVSVKSGLECAGEEGVYGKMRVSLPQRTTPVRTWWWCSLETAPQ